MIKYSSAFVTIATKDLDSAIEFYQQLLKQDPQPFIPKVYAEFNLKGLRLGIFQPKKNNQSEFSNSTGSRMSICIEVENIEAAIAYLNEIESSPPGEIMTPSHGKEIYAYDRDGNRLILHQSI
ncbi:MAG: VOC family protein [Prochloraceae cyanobacterium]